MKGLRTAIVLFAVALIFAMAFSARADKINKLTLLTFNQPVELPGNVVLQPGTYAFTVLQTLGGNRTIVQVFK